MAEKLPVVTGGQLRRALRRAGWTEVRQRGSHVRLEKGASASPYPKLGRLLFKA